MVSTDFLHSILGRHFAWLYAESWQWTAIGFLGSALFSSRFLIQWWYSEKHKKLLVPPIFWHLSFWGSVLCLLYALHVDKAPIIASYVFLPVLYARNLWMLNRERRGQGAN